MPITLPQGATDAAAIVEPGYSVVLANGITAAQSGGASASLRGTNPWFTVQPRGDAGFRVLNLLAKGAGAIPTTATATLYASDDGGATWQLYAAAIPLVATGVATDAQTVNVVAGLIFQVLVTALTLGSATSVSVDGQVS